MKTALLELRLGIMICCLLLATGCSSPATRFYVLSALPESAPAAAGRELAVGVGPLEFPDYLDRPQIVTRTGQNELNLAEFENWAEPLEDNATQVLAENLAEQLPSRRISTYPWKRANPVDIQVVAKITRFDHSEGGETVLSARWRLLSGDGTKELLARESRYRERPAGASYGATVATMSRAPAQFCRDVAAAVRSEVSDSRRSP